MVTPRGSHGSHGSPRAQLLASLADRGVRRIVYALLGTGTVVGLLFGYRPSGPVLAPPSTVASTTPDRAVSGSAAAPSSAASGTFLGDAVSTRWGPVQVRITVSAGRITAVDTPRLPDSNPHDVEINRRAAPVLAQEVLSTQSADIDTVSGATVTSRGYIGSLQSAIDEAGL